MLSLYDAHFHYGIERPFSAVRACLNFDHQLATGGIVNGTHPHDWPDIVQFSQKRRQFIPALGVHPRKVLQCPQDWLDRLQAIPKPMNYLIGEIGLDASPKFRSSMPVQISIFSTQWQLAQSQKRIAIIHCVRALGPLLKEMKSTPATRQFLMHAYSGPADLISQLIDLGAYFSFNLKQIKSKSKRIGEVISAIPSDRILVESDQDALKSHMGVSQSENSIHLTLRRGYQGIAKIRQQTIASFVTQVERNFLQFLE